MARTCLFVLLAATFLVGSAGGQIPDDVMYAHFIDVGQGDATLLEFSCGAVLIDAGGHNAQTTTDLLTYLDGFFSDRTDLNNTLDLVLITHNHVDHTRSLREVVDRYTVLNLVENGQRGGLAQGDADVNWVNANAQTGGRNITVLDVDDSNITGTQGFTNATIDPVNCSGTDPVIRILSADLSTDPGWDTDGDEFRNKNNHSIAIRVDFGDATFLFTGDLEEPAIETMVLYYENTDILDTDVYRVGHHGSYNGTTVSLLEAASPEIAVISMSGSDVHESWTGWAYGHPRTDAIELLKDEITRDRSAKWVDVADGTRNFHSEYMRDAIFATGWDGTVTVRATASGRYRVTRQH